MNNSLIIFVFSLLLSACVTAPDPRPDPYLKGEELLLEGVNAYKTDHYDDARQKLQQALTLYQSFDNRRGTVIAQLNLVETALAQSHFLDAESTLKALRSTPLHDAELDLDYKIALLEMKLDYEQQRYQPALAKVQALLTQAKTSEEKLKLWAMQARLEVLIAPLNQSDGLTAFAAAVAELKENQQTAYEYHQAWLNRISAQLQAKQSDYVKATELLTEALNYYQQQANRRAIAASLEELADLELAQQHNSAAKTYLNRALTIYLWLKNDVKSEKINTKLQNIR